MLFPLCVNMNGLDVLRAVEYIFTVQCIVVVLSYYLHYHLHICSLVSHEVNEESYS